MKALILSILVSLFTVMGQVLWKLGLGKIETAKFASFDTVLKIMCEPHMIIGTIVYILATLLWFYLLKFYDLSYVYPFMSLTFIFSLMASVIILKENVSLTRCAGALVVFAGVFIILKFK